MTWCISVGILNLQNHAENYALALKFINQLNECFGISLLPSPFGILSAWTVLEFNAELSCDTWKQHYYFTSNRGKLSNTTKLTKQISTRSRFWILSPCLNHKITHYSSAPITSELHILKSKHQKHFYQSLNYFQAWQEDFRPECSKHIYYSISHSWDIRC